MAATAASFLLKEAQTINPSVSSGHLLSAFRQPLTQPRWAAWAVTCPLPQAF